MTSIGLLLVALAPALGQVDTTQDEHNRQNRAYQDAYGLILERQWKEAEAAFAAFVGSEWSPTAQTRPHYADARFWQCYAIEKGGDLPRGFDCYSLLLKETPYSNWVDDAKAAMVRISSQLARRGDKGEQGAYALGAALLQADQDEQVRVTALVALAQQGDSTSLALVRQAFRRAKVPKVTPPTLAILSSIDSPQGRELFSEIATTHPDWEVRRDAVIFMRHPGFVPALKKIADEDDILDVQVAACAQLGALATALNADRAAAAIDALIDIVRDHPLSPVREKAVGALGKCPSPKARQVLVEIVGAQ